jgi:hypothetical protein
MRVGVPGRCRAARSSIFGDHFQVHCAFVLHATRGCEGATVRSCGGSSYVWPLLRRW